MKHESIPASGSNGAQVTRFLRLRDVVSETSLSQATIYRRIKTGDFPAAFRLTAGRVAWLESDITQWKLTQMAQPSA
jgi:prophage regulatory protein